MRRNRTNFHDLTVKRLVFVIVLTTATSIGSSENYEPPINHNFHRSSAGKHEIPSMRHSKIERKDILSNDMKFREFHRVPNFNDNDTLKSRRNAKNFTHCIDTLVKRHPDICEIVIEIENVKKRVPQLLRAIEEKTGARRFDLKLLLGTGKNMLELLREGASGITTAVDFAFDLLGKTKPMSSLSRSSFNKNAQSSEINRSYRPSVSRNGKDSFRQNDALAVESEHFRETNDEQDDKITFQNCPANIERNDGRACEILRKIDESDRFLIVRRNSRRSGVSTKNTKLLVKIDSNNISLGNIFDATRKSLLNERNLESSGATLTNAWNDFRNKRTKIVSPNGRRDLVNEIKEEVAEILVGPDFRIEFIRLNDDRSVGDKTREWRRKDFQSYKSENIEKNFALPMYDQLKYSTLDFVRGKEKIPSENVGPGADAKIILGPSYLPDILPARRISLNDYEHQEISRRIKDRDPSGLGLFHSANLITTKKHTNRPGIDIQLKEEFPSTTKMTIEMDEDSWIQWIYKKVAEISNDLLSLLGLL